MSFETGNYVRIAKLGPTDKPYAPTPSWEEFDENKENYIHSIPTNYVAEGKLINILTVGHCLHILREKRNEVEMLDIFRTSHVVKIIDETELSVVFETENSRYKMTKV